MWPVKTIETRGRSRTGTHLSPHISYKEFHLFWRIVPFSISFSMEECKFEIELVGDYGDSADHEIPASATIGKSDETITVWHHQHPD
jgi:hypothetical protein